jgi:hypothetical protein
MKCDRCDKDTATTKRLMSRNLCPDCYSQVKNWKRHKRKIEEKIVNRRNKNEQTYKQKRPQRKISQ